MFYKWLIIFASVLIYGCATSEIRQFTVTSKPEGAQVDVNGMYVGNTPTKVDLECSKKWVGIANSADGWSYDTSIYTITVYPSKDLPGISQTKNVNACQWRGAQAGALLFDLGLKDMPKEEKIDLNITTPASK